MGVASSFCSARRSAFRAARFAAFLLLRLLLLLLRTRCASTLPCEPDPPTWSLRPRTGGPVEGQAHGRLTSIDVAEAALGARPKKGCILGDTIYQDPVWKPVL